MAKGKSPVQSTKEKMIKEGNNLETQADILSGNVPLEINKGKKSNSSKSNTTSNTPDTFSKYLESAQQRFSDLTPDKDSSSDFGGAVKITRLVKTSNTNTKKK